MTAIIVAATFASILALTPAVNGSTEQPITIQGMSGTVEISTNGIEWTPLVSSDTISLGDSVRTGTNSVLLIQFSGGKIVLGQNTNVTYTDPHGLHHILLLLLGIIWADLQSATGGSDNYEADLGSNVAVGVRGTEFTATVYENGTANVMVIEGLVEVQDLASNSTVSLQANQTITVPNVSGGLSQQDMSQAVETVNPNSTGAWWEESPIGPIATLTPSSTLSTTTLAVYVVGAAVVAVVVAGALVLYIRRRKVKR
jgi:hypothetical protein